jgi:chromosome segregation ATPase
MSHPNRRGTQHIIHHSQLHTTLPSQVTNDFTTLTLLPPNKRPRIMSEAAAADSDILMYDPLRWHVEGLAEAEKTLTELKISDKRNCAERITFKENSIGYFKRKIDWFENTPNGKLEVQMAAVKGEVAAAEGTIKKVDDNIKKVDGEINTVGHKIEEIDGKLKHSKQIWTNEFNDDDREMHDNQLKNWMNELKDEKKLLMDEKKLLMDKEKLLMDKEKLLMDKEKQLSKKVEELNDQIKMLEGPDESGTFLV